MYTYEYPRPAVTSDALIFGYDPEINEISLLLIQRKNEPFREMWALPGGFLDMEETVETCAIRELEEETRLKNIPMQQLITASKLGRDPRGRTVSVIFWAFIETNYNAMGNDDAKEAVWFNIKKIPPLAFDHSEIVEYAIDQLKYRVHLFDYFLDFFTDEVVMENIEKIRQILFEN